MSDAQRESVKSSIEYIQNFDPTSIIRLKDLGLILSFESAVPILNRTIELYRRIPISQLDIVSSYVIKNLYNRSEQFKTIIKSISDFSPKNGDQVSDRDNLIDQLSDFYDGSFNEFYSLIGYFSGQRNDMAEHERKAKILLNEIDTNSSIYAEKLSNLEKEAQLILEQTKKLAAEQGVSQKAVYFKNEAIIHNLGAKKWAIFTFVSAFIFAIFAFLSMFLHKLPIFASNSSYDIVQLAISKVLIFGLLGYLVSLSARNFMSHKHNEVLNKHRQNSLLTFQSFADATRGGELQNVILNHAASCIFSPQETGYTKPSQSNDAIHTRILEVAPKINNQLTP